MFLDDKLYNTVKEIKPHLMSDNLHENLQQLINDLYKICEDDFKPKIEKSMHHREVAIIMDRVFNSWDLFVDRLIKEKILIPFVKLLVI